jgi:hypothetical protein
MRTPLRLVSLILPLFFGCAGANIAATSWASKIQKGKALTRCESLDMRNNKAMASVFKRYDGWHLIYVSEYTTSNQVGTSATVCFEGEEAKD